MDSRKVKTVALAGIAVMITVAAGIFAYRGSREGNASLDDWYCSPYTGNWNYSDRGMFYYGGEGISYLDAESGKGVSVCTKAGCRHEDKNCPAYIEDSLHRAGIVYDGKNLYYIGSSEDCSSLNLTECDINGENRKKIAYFPDMQLPTAIAYHGDAVIIAYTNDTDLKKREEVNNREAGIYVYDRKKKQGKKIYHEKAWRNTILSLDVIDGYIYFCRIYSPLTEKEIMQKQSAGEEQLDEAMELYRIPLDGGEDELISDQISTTWAGVTGVGDMVLFSTHDGLQAYLPQKRKIKTIKQGKNIFLVTSRLTDAAGVIRQTGENYTSTYYICSQDGTLKEIGNSDTILNVVYDHVSYAFGDNSIDILDTEKWRKGDFKVRHTFPVR